MEIRNKITRIGLSLVNRVKPDLFNQTLNSVNKYQKNTVKLQKYLPTVSVIAKPLENYTPSYVPLLGNLASVSRDIEISENSERLNNLISDLNPYVIGIKTILTNIVS